ncbi:MAG TPA: deoxyribose-phosphate aldolase [Gemmatimonadales bacterium]|nr:deoxyribose-phosphate aldolase [Gemmatimonadales bacterium]
MPDRVLPPWLAAEAGARGLGRFIDHTLLRPETTRAQIQALCDEARRHGVKAVCVNGAWTAHCAGRLAGSAVAVATVVGFPLGASAPAAKACETHRAVEDGASEIDMVIALGPARSGEWRYVEDDIRAVIGAAGTVPVKVILETAALEPREIEAACGAAVAAGAAFVKTSTGFHPAGGATPEAVALMRRTVGPAFGVKASGGIRTKEAALDMLAAGANRIGTSATAAMADWLGPAAPTIEELLG